MAIEIKSGVPIPGPRYENGEKFPFRQMKVGDMFVFDDNRSQSKAGSAAGAAAKAIGNGVKFATRRLEDGKIGCWRTA